MIPAAVPKAFAPERHVGTPNAAAPARAAALIARAKKRVAWLLLADTAEVERFAEALSFFQKDHPFKRLDARDVLVFPEIPDLEAGDPRRFEAECDRLAVLARLNSDDKTPLAVCATARALVQQTPAPERLARDGIALKKGGVFPFGELTRRLSETLGYDNEAVCETPGEFAVRGGIIDVYPLNADEPVRIDFFGDTVESLRAFDPTTQRSLRALDSLFIAPAPERAARETAGAPNAFAADFLPKDGVLWLVHEPARLARLFPDVFQKPETISLPQANLHTVFERRAHAPDAWVSLSEFDEEDPLFAEAPAPVAHTAEPLAAYRPFTALEGLGADRLEAETRARNAFLARMAGFARAGETVVFALPTRGEIERLEGILADLPEWKDLPRTLVEGAFGGDGFRELGENGAPASVLVGETEVFGKFRKHRALARARRLPQRSRVDQLLDFSELADGDLLVHLAHGVCRFRGLRALETPDGAQEVVSLEFDGGAILHLPLHEAHLLSRYVGLAKTAPKLGKLGTGFWEKTRRAAEAAALDYAAELLALQAKRTTRPGLAFGPDETWQREMEKAFPFRETPDQLRAIEDVKADMQRPRPMDRLICGDVGFGKTEVALRAAFKAAVNGYQVAVLAPTTVLAQQHFNTFRERFAGFPVVVEMLSRFRSAKQQAQILAQLKEGKIDILIGTHRLLGKAAHFRKIGLLVVDEEHRFGVRQKEILKKLRDDIDVLTLSATPIPRTLYFALMGVRDLSVIETPPVNRLPIQTVVQRYSPELVARAVRYELGRGGQVFYLHNRVETIAAAADRLRALVPEARIGVGHGRMDAEALEELMTRFVAGEYDVLVCTTIIESGLDIPNCNTLIIEGADRFGLAQLYQLRGRVGRFDRQAYAYLLLHKNEALLDAAHKRLSALKQYNQLGSGFRIAMRDLELRGAGNLLGARQSGHIAGVGFDLYCTLLRQSIARLKGEPLAKAVRASVHLDFVLLGEPGAAAPAEPPEGFFPEAADSVRTIAAYLPAAYIAEPRLRIDAYRKFALADTPEQVRDILEGLRDRFGAPPPPVEALAAVHEIRARAEAAGVVSVETAGDKLRCMRIGRKGPEPILVGNRFPRLTQRAPLSRMGEILYFLHQQRSAAQ